MAGYLWGFADLFLDEMGQQGHNGAWRVPFDFSPFGGVSGNDLMRWVLRLPIVSGTHCPPQ